METAKKLYQELLDVRMQIQALQEREEELNDAIAKEISPYKKGDITEIYGTTHTGKKGRIDDIKFGFGNRKYPNLIVYAEVLKKDGSISNFDTYWRNPNDPQLEEAIKKLTGKTTREHIRDSL